MKQEARDYGSIDDFMAMLTPSERKAFKKYWVKCYMDSLMVKKGSN